MEEKEKNEMLMELTGVLLKALPRTPKKQMARLSTGRTVAAYHCGYCGSMIFRDQNYCPRCGQRAKWEEEE